MTTKTKTPKKITPVMLAKDVLKLLESRRFKPVTGGYVEPTGRVHLDGDAQATLKNKAFKCEVCALGAAFCAYVLRVDNHLGGFSREKLGEVLAPEQMTLIESAFEATFAWGSGRVSAAELYAAIDFGERYTSDSGRLRAIMRNIIANDGKFKPEVKAKAR